MYFTEQLLTVYIRNAQHICICEMKVSLFLPHYSVIVILKMHSLDNSLIGQQ